MREGDTQVLGKNKGVLLVIFCSLSAALALSGCGPVNQKPASAVSATDGALSSSAMVQGTKENVGFSQKGEYLVLNRYIAANGQTKPGKGFNQFEIRILRESDLAVAPSDLEVQIYYRPTKAAADEEHHLAPSDIQKAADGSYTTDFTFQQHGTWEIHVQLTEGTLSDEHVFQVKI
jgi:hypothetical protein